MILDTASGLRRPGATTEGSLALADVLMEADLIDLRGGGHDGSPKTCTSLLLDQYHVDIEGGMSGSRPSYPPRSLGTERVS